MKLLLGTRTLNLDLPTYHETNRNEKIYITSSVICRALIGLHPITHITFITARERQRGIDM
jgi:hypothetical protein